VYGSEKWNNMMHKIETEFCSNIEFMEFTFKHKFNEPEDDFHNIKGWSYTENGEVKYIDEDEAEDKARMMRAIWTQDAETQEEHDELIRLADYLDNLDNDSE
jgi:hypothetical protein